MSTVRERSFWTALLLAVVALKLAMILVDPQVRLFLGDSASFLYDAREDDWTVPDRSIVYPLLIRAMVPEGDSLGRLLYWQALAGGAIAMLLAYVLRERLAAPRAVVFAAVCLFAIEPAELFYERMVMAETLGLLAFTAFFAAACTYLARPNILWLPLALSIGLAAVTLRMNYLPVVAVISLGLPLLLLLDPERRLRRRRIALHALVAVVAFAGFHGAYKRHIAETFEGKAGYIGRAGFMRMGLVAPLIKPEHFVRVGLPADFASRLKFDLSDPDRRPQQLWNQGGLADAIANAGLDVEATCRKLSIDAIRDDPLGIVRLGFHTVAGYFDKDTRALRLRKDLGRDPAPYPEEVVANVRQYWNYDLTGVAEHWTFVSRWFSAGSGWLIACLFALFPLGIANAVVHWRSEHRVQALLGFLFAAGLVATQVLFSNIISYRYLHAFPFFVLVNAIPLLVAWARGRGAAANALAIGAS